eukprot:UN10806
MLLIRSRTILRAISICHFLFQMFVVSLKWHTPSISNIQYFHMVTLIPLWLYNSDIIYYWFHFEGGFLIYRSIL